MMLMFINSLSGPEIAIQLGSRLTGAGPGVGGIVSLVPQLKNLDILGVVAGEQLFLSGKFSFLHFSRSSCFYRVLILQKGIYVICRNRSKRQHPIEKQTHVQEQMASGVTGNEEDQSIRKSSLNSTIQCLAAARPHSMQCFGRIWTRFCNNCGSQLAPRQTVYNEDGREI
jgi:hypothetical protein